MKPNFNGFSQLEEMGEDKIENGIMESIRIMNYL